MHPQTIFHLVPKTPAAEAILEEKPNTNFKSLSSSRLQPLNDGEDGPQLGLEVGYHVALVPRPDVIAEAGRRADIYLRGGSISAVQFSFEIHTESRAIMFHDRSRLRNTNIKPFRFRTDGHLRQHVLQPGIEYVINTGGDRGELYEFELRWVQKEVAVQRAEQGYETAAARVQDSRWARTVDDGPTELPSWYNTRLHTPADGGIQRTTEGDPLGEGAYGEVRRAVDLDSGYSVAVKKVVLSKIKSAPEDLENLLWREVKTLSSISHKHIVEYLGSAGWGTETIYIYTSLKDGNVSQLMEKFPAGRSDKATLTQLLREMLGALDYLAFRGLCHRDVKPDNILYLATSDTEYIFQLADFGFANRKNLAHTHCGTGAYMAPEMYYDTHSQTPKLDVWSLFATIIDIMRTAGFDGKKVKSYGQVLSLIRTAATMNPQLSPMAREDPELRASAAQMLVQCFQGNGLSTPRAQVGTIPLDDDGRSRLQAPGPSDAQPKAPTKPGATLKRGNLPSSRELKDRKDKVQAILGTARVQRRLPFPRYA